ncbi:MULTISPECIES: hypothetical protein [unclassified Sphingomonas]|uniref:hypothetical protein n=1 Tax=unclassified Sphingomonas TaxID=196159 RepID=UPI0006F246F2|nr:MULTISPECIES: hypothetical protein [unclassified Sphingomonas]KQM63567.1 hypothetical protein ASE65_17105 [Sphingomonas sp. Leaf16]KQN15183.1 hypothetical protein ASE81_17120 [Sphingomonas sp. Leaf29]KQN20717.1 hypothetical protein ASE83_17085 [Sphingomonas sp. Leaf32]
MFTLFRQDGRDLMTVVAGGVGMYEITIRLSAQEVAALCADETRAIALARDVVTRTAAYADRRVSPAIDPRNDADTVTP